MYKEKNKHKNKQVALHSKYLILFSNILNRSEYFINELIFQTQLKISIWMLLLKKSGWKSSKKIQN